MSLLCFNAKSSKKKKEKKWNMVPGTWKGQDGDRPLICHAAVGFFWSTWVLNTNFLLMVKVWIATVSKTLPFSLNSVTGKWSLLRKWGSAVANHTKGSRREFKKIERLWRVAEIQRKRCRKRHTSRKFWAQVIVLNCYQGVTEQRMKMSITGLL